MRLTEIKIARDSYSRFIQSLPNGDFSGSVGVQFALRDKEPVARTLGRLVASPALALLRSGAQRKLKTDLGFYADRLAIGERFADDSAWAFLLGRLPPAAGLSVLIPGCYMGGEDVQFWLRRGISLLEGIDVYSLVSSWSSIVPSLRGRWRGSEVNFQQGSIENIPFEDNTFDVISTTAVLEHVRNIGAMVEETARVLKPGGFALHSFGPLYYSYGADHCIAAYGLEAGYDHLLLDEDDYRRRIASRAYFERTTGNADLGFWAVNDQFSFATPLEYLDTFKSRFDIEYVAAKISTEGLEYRSRFPMNWKRLMDAGVREGDLLIKGLTVVLRKPMPVRLDS